MTLRPLIQSTIAGERAAWSTLQAALEPTILSIARRHSGLRNKSLATNADDLREVVVATLEKLCRDDFHNLRAYLERSSEASDANSDAFDTWIYGAVDYVIRAHLRKRYGRAPKPSTDESKARPPSKRDLQSHAGRIEDADTDRSLLETLGMTTKLTVAQIFAHIDRVFDASEVQAMRMYYAEDRTFEEIAQQLGIADDKSAERLVRRLNARLRYHFTAQTERG
jgi:RNA polymerase sigma factor (sigma-70 family)